MAKKILFLCTGNSCRSQMAQAFTQAFYPDTWEAYSAGSSPGAIDPKAIQVMSEVNVDISKNESKSLNKFLDQNFDYIVTLCDSARQACPIFPGKAIKVHKGFDDPPILTRDMLDEEKILSVYRRVRDEIQEMVKGLPDSIL